MHAASQLPGRGPTVVDMAPIYLHLNKKSNDDDDDDDVTHNIYIPKLSVKVTVWGQMSNYVFAITLKSDKANFININRQIRHHERVCYAQDTGSHT